MNTALNPGLVAKRLYYRFRNHYVRSQWEETQLKGTKHNIYPALGLIFVHIPKTAGTSLHEFFSNLEDRAIAAGCNPSLELADLSNDPDYHKHWKAQDYIGALGMEAWSRLNTFAVVRNPWDFAVSSYHWWLEKGDMFPRHLNSALRVKNMKDFDEFIRSDIFLSTTTGHPGEMRDWFQLNDIDVVGTVVRFEELESEATNFANNLRNWEFEPTLPHSNRTTRKPYQDYFKTAESIELVRRKHAYIVDRFSYTFE